MLLAARPTALLLVAALSLTACGGDDGSGDAEGSDPAEQTTETSPTAAPEPTAVWVGAADDRTLMRVDPATGAVERFQLNDGPWALEYAAESLWVLSPEVQRLDPATVQPADVLFEDIQVHNFLVDGDGIWLSLQDEPKLVRYDLASGQPEDEVQLPSDDVWLESMVLTDGFMLAENSYNGTVVKIDLATGEIAAKYNPDAVIWDLELVGDSLWVAYYDGLVELDAATLAVRRPVQGVDAAYALEVDETGVLWAGLDDSVGTVDAASGQYQPVASVGTGSGGVDDIEVSAESVWITHEDVGLLRLDRATNELDRPIALPGAGTFAPTFELALQ